MSCPFVLWPPIREQKLTDSCRNLHYKGLPGCFPTCGFDSTERNNKEPGIEGKYTETDALDRHNRVFSETGRIFHRPGCPYAAGTQVA